MQIKLKRSVISFILIAVILSSLTVCCFAYNQYVVDNTGVLTDKQLEYLEEKSTEISKLYGIDTAIYITDSFNGIDPGMFSDKYFQDSGYSKNCSILVIAINDRKYFLYNCGEASNAITDYGSYYIDDKVIPYLKNDDWYSAGLQYLNFYSEFYDRYQSNGTAYDIDNRPEEIRMILIQIFGSTGIGFLISILILNNKKKEMKSVKTVNNADKYTDFSSFKLTSKNDTFVDKHVIITPIPQIHDDNNMMGHGGTTMNTGVGGHHYSGHGGSF